jgi:hypothetical protein
MSTFQLLSDEHLLISIIRKLRLHESPDTGSQLAPEGTHFDSLFATAVATSLFKQEEFDGLVRELVANGALVLTGRLSFHDGEEQKIKSSEQGRIMALHSEGLVVEHQFFTENWTPITAHRSKETNRRLYPLDDMSYHRLKIIKVHIVSDGLSSPVAEAPVIYPVE